MTISPKNSYTSLLCDAIYIVWCIVNNFQSDTQINS